MAEFIVPKVSVWEEFELKTELITPPKIKLKITPVYGQDRFAGEIAILDAESIVNEKGEKEILFSDGIKRALKVIINSVMDHVVGWDLTIGTKPIACNKKNKEKYLYPLLWERIIEKKEDQVDGEKKEKLANMFQLLGTEIYKFASRQKNFLKN